ncbi:MAG: carboxypeptidase-like regulatory domain-containing protein [Bacteroidota bacterium]
MKIKFTLLLLLFALFAQAQFRIEGKVIDSVTQQPLVGINIFLSHTTIGINSNEKGEFQLGNLKQGLYELVVSSLNYEDYIIPIQIGQNTNPLLIKMKPTANILKEVVVESYDEKGWEKWGDQFLLNFMGSPILANHCKLLNPEVVKFKFNPKTKRLRAFSNEKLIFENRNLGYKIHYLLTKFELDFNTKSFAYKGYPLFEELTTNKPKEAKKWTQLRNETFKGSIRHFIRSLYADELEKNGFEMRAVLTVNTEEKKRATDLINQLQDKFAKGDSAIFKINKDSLDYYVKASSLNYGENKVTLSKLITANNITFLSKNKIDSLSNSVYFEGMLQVMFTKKKMLYEYIRLIPNFTGNDNIRTDIYLRPNKIIYIYQNGSFFSGLDLFTEGYWSWSEKIATLMPSDYLFNIKE